MEMKKVYTGDLVEVFEVAKNVYFRSASLERGQCNGAYIVGENEVAVVDMPPNGLEIFDEAEEIFHKPVKYVFITHAHGDHVGALPEIWDKDVTVFLSRRVRNDLLPDRPCRATFVGVEGLTPIRLSNGTQIELLTYHEWSHSKGDLFVRLPESKILCTGDCVVEYQTAYLHNADLDGWVETLQKVNGLNDDYLLSGHADELLPFSYLADFTGHIQALRDAAKACLTQVAAYRTQDDIEEVVRRVVDEYFANGSDEAAGIEKRAGSESAKRELAMALWALVREML
jgi:glyoxylase-like metal-dependent hydrolase (beta-lactamase superfamily II)